MTITLCPYCPNQVKESDTTCPHCGMSIVNQECEEKA
ncbi:TPA: zinc ribbon domain-containing protein [Vibrio cholerae]